MYADKTMIKIKIAKELNPSLPLSFPNLLKNSICGLLFIVDLLEVGRKTHIFFDSF